MVGVKEIAELAGVSPATVSNVLNGRKNVGKETRQRILQICKELSYEPQASEQKRKEQENRTILFNFSDFDRGFYLSIINGINSYVTDNDYDLIICTTKSSEKFMQNGLTCGCICLDMRMKTEILRSAASADYPIVLLDRKIDHPYTKSIVVNNYDSMRALVQGLVDRKYRKFGFIGGPEHTEDNEERYHAFIDVLEENSLVFQRKNYYSGDYRRKSGYHAAKIMILQDKLPDCVVCANDNMAIGAIRAFKEAGIRVPEDIGVTGFDNSNLADHLGLTTVDIPNFERGYLAAQYLIENIQGRNDQDTLKVKAEVKWRNSVYNTPPKK